MHHNAHYVSIFDAGLVYGIQGPQRLAHKAYKAYTVICCEGLNLTDFFPLASYNFQSSVSRYSISGGKIMKVFWQKSILCMLDMLHTPAMQARSTMPNHHFKILL